jgi:1-phosphofructokinase
MTDPADGRPVRVCVFSPAPLLTVTFETDVDGQVELHLHPGGQGIWVARMVGVLGGEPVLCGPFGGETGQVARALAAAAGTTVKAVPIHHANGAYVHDRSDGERRVLLETEPPVLDRHELDELYSVTLGAALDAGVCVLAGSHLSTVVPSDTYRRLAHDLEEAGVVLVADLAGDLLQAVLDGGGVDILKISHEELLADGLASSDDPAELAVALGKLHDAGAASVVISRADEPALALVDDRVVEAAPPRFAVVDHRGAGDSMTAALAVAAARGWSGLDGLRLAAAAGSLNVTRHGLASGHGEAIAQLAPLVEIRPFDPAGSG